MNLAINDFVQKVSGGGVGVFFFAGHGLQINNQNYLVPIDMDTPNDPADVVDQAVSVPILQDKLADAKAKYTLLVLDACRNNPLPKKSRAFDWHNARSGDDQFTQRTNRSLFGGCQSEALDSLGNNDKNPNGLFTREFLPTISQPGISSTEALKKTRSMVIQKAKSVGHEQQPAIYDQADGDFYFVSGPAPAQKSAAAGAAGGRRPSCRQLIRKPLNYPSGTPSRTASSQQTIRTILPSTRTANSLRSPVAVLPR
ncbi:MAG: caspase family protein [Propionivibrio sp.]|nr:caspase family protein [Propionivibrio sp.]